MSIFPENTEYGGLSVYFKNYKCFGEDPQGFDEIKRMNIIIGKNNCGKSTLLDPLGKLTLKELTFKSTQFHKNQPPEIIISQPLKEDWLVPVFRQGTMGGGLIGDHWEYGKRYINKKIKYGIRNKSSKYFIDIENSGEPHISDVPMGSSYTSDILDRTSHSLSKKIFARIHAERDVIAEVDEGVSDSIFINSSTGRGITNIISNYLNKGALPEELIDNILHDLNSIFAPETQFKEIKCQQGDGSLWEIYLVEEKKGRIALSSSGSGLKTVIMVLVNIHLFPHHYKKDLNEFIFAFEELENNLHPALLRRLLSYLYEKSCTHDCPFFITTHSSVLIDQFSQKEDCQIVHVKHNGETSEVRRIKTYVENNGVLDDLDVRASDILQANGIIWVEGPSDRIYLNKWIEKHTGGALVEGTHYQCMFYGGRLLSHLEKGDPNEISSLVNIMGINRNAAILIDSDKETAANRINATKARIKREFEEHGSFVWITKGREIENYLNSKLLSTIFNKPNLAQIGDFEKFFDTYIPRLSLPSSVFSANDKKKSLFAERVATEINKDNMYHLDLKERLDSLVNEIKKWNGMNENT